MNAPLSSLAQLSPDQSYEQVARVTHEVAGQLAQRLRQHTQGEVLFSAADRGRYATDASIYQVIPVGVFVPRHIDEVGLALDICRDLDVPIVPRGGGTSQCGQTVGVGLVIDHTKHVHRILEIDPKQATAVVEPGLVLDHLNAELKRHGLWFPVDVSTSGQATLGGMAGNNSCGSRSIAYGNMVHNVLGAQAWLPDGSLLDWGPFEQSMGRSRDIGQFLRKLAERLAPDIEANWPKVLRRVAGYNLDIFHPQSPRPYTPDGSVNLAHLLIGSEGTLALTKQLKLQLSPLPRTKVLGVVNFPSFHQAMASAQHIVKLGDPGQLMAVELVDRTMIELSLQNPAFTPTVRTALIGEPDAVLLVEFAGDTKEQIAPWLDRLEELMGDLGLPHRVVKLLDDTAQKNLWEVRKAGLNIMMSLRGDGKPVSFIEDCAVPLEHLAEYTAELTEVFHRHGTRGTWYAHASVGTLHVRPILDMRRDGAPKMRAIAEEASALVRRFKGAYSGEHGDGLCRGEWIRWQYGDAIHKALRDIKAELDPKNLLCPGRIVAPPAMDDTTLMRFPPSYRVIPIQTGLDWSAWDVQNDARTEEVSAPGSGGDPAQGLAKAVEMCNNNGHCRKFDAGTMCPSYRVTRDEQHLTRGRANTLRLALSGQLGPDALTSDELLSSLSLCVGCKGCKRECPTGVDMARMKIEVMHQVRQKKGLSLRERLVAYLPDYARHAARCAPLLNARNQMPWLARMTDRLLGLAAQRSLPKWESRHFFNRGTMGVSAAQALASNQAVVLFVDTFNGHFDSDLALDAFKVLSAAGYDVHVAAKTDGGHGANQGHLCCGRTYLSNGLLDQARVKATELLQALRPFAEKGVAIVGLEPSCLLTLRDEYSVMGLGEDADLVARHSLMLEEFLARELKAGRLDALKARLGTINQPILVHGHCHQKAMGLMPELMEVVRLLPGAAPRLIDTSCCGMAGSFGMEREHVELSMQMAELSLLPALRSSPDALIVADGTSCRHQIQDGSQRHAIHVASLLARHLK
ncbi:MAG: FAD-linked oxidase C-terminal domain-containing protein [Alphaproteobacteria bacterium]|nr:FAD-linked oxidase C-terminal domain-containing protein [Alphaproteobacteria bacterium]